MTLILKPRLLLRCWSWLALMWQARLLLASVSLLQGLYLKRHPPFCTHFHFLSQLGKPFNHSLFRQIHRTQTKTKKNIFKIKNTIGKTSPPFVQTSKRLALGCNGFSQQDVQHGRGIVQKNMFFLFETWNLFCVCTLSYNKKTNSMCISGAQIILSLFFSSGVHLFLLHRSSMPTLMWDGMCVRWEFMRNQAYVKT